MPTTISKLPEGDYSKIENVWIPGSEGTSATRKFKLTGITSAWAEQTSTVFTDYTDKKVCCLYKWTSKQLEEVTSTLDNINEFLTDIPLSALAPDVQQAVNKANVIKLTGAGNTYLADNGQYKPINTTGITLLGRYSSYEDLIAAHPTGKQGDAYTIAGDLWIWDVDTKSWVNAGSFEGKFYGEFTILPNGDFILTYPN